MALDHFPESAHTDGQACGELIEAIVEMGYPEEFGLVLAGELRSDAAIRRMTAYLRSSGTQPPEQIADEMLAICQERDRWVERKKSEWAEAKVTEFYNRER